jgi:hypothetical protein
MSVLKQRNLDAKRMSCESVMTKWTWTLILAGAVVLLFLWSIREHFTSYEDALKDVGQTAGYTDLTKPKKAETKNKADAAKAAEEEASAALKAFQALGPINSQAESVERDKELQRINGLQEKARKLSSEADEERASQRGTEGAPISEATMRARCSNEISTKEWDKVSAECKAFMSNTPSNPSARPVGGSLQVPQPNPGGSGLPQGFRKGNIWGPAYTGMGDNSGDGLGSGARDYPTLLGPQPKEATMVEGAGIAQPSIKKLLAKKGALPSSGSMGADEESKFFGASRLPGGAGGPDGAGGGPAGGPAGSTVPGDQDMYPGYFGGAGSTAYTSSTGSSKTEPVPFLADFSAFLH